MFKGKVISVSIPCYNEASFIGKTLLNIPDFVDKIYVIDDCSSDKSVQVITSLSNKDKRIMLIKNKKNMGNGYSVVQGFKMAIKDGSDTICIVAGDNQCRIEYLEKLVDGVVTDKYSYVKANRFTHIEELKTMSKFRQMGNIIMSLLSKFASGYYSILDPLNSYSAIDAAILKKIPLDQLSHRYDFENSFLLHMYLVNASIKDVSVPARYDGEKSDINLMTYVPTTSYTLIKSFISRIYYKYIFQTLHPIGLFMVFGSILLLFGLLYGLLILLNTIKPGHNPSTSATVMISVVPFFIGFQLLLQAVVLDIQNEPKLHETN